MKLNIKNKNKWNLSNLAPILIAGPCSVESEEQILSIAQSLSRFNITLLRGGIWKPRTRPNSFEGIGIRGLKWLKNAGDSVNLPVTVEVALPEHIEACLKIGINAFWIGARTTPNPFAVQKIADSLKGVDIPVMVKNPICPDIGLWIGALERLNKAGITKLAAIHRGFSTYHKGEFRNDPLWRIPLELRQIFPELPIICDPSHISGQSEKVLSIAQYAFDLLMDGLMIEVHLTPEKALSDAKQQLTPKQFAETINCIKLKKISSRDQHLMSAIHHLRNQMDIIDENILQLLSKRMEISREIGNLKKKNTLSTFQPERWQTILKMILDIGTKLNLSENFILNIYQYIHEESLRQQELP